MEFSKYQKLSRLGTLEVDGIKEGLGYVFPKIDGTNGSVWLKEGELKAGSRNRELSLDKDNANFYENVRENEQVKNYLEHNPTHRLYGEYLVPHTLKTYKDDAWNKFYVFDVVDEETGMYLTYEEYQPLLEKYEVDYIPLISKKENFTTEELQKLANEVDFLVEEGEGSGEGVVLKNYDFVNRFGRVTWAKVISEKFGKKSNRNKNKKENKGTEVEDRIVELYCTEDFIEKEFAKINLKYDGFSSRNIGELLGRVWHELLDEEIVNAVKKLRNPVVDFNVLQKLVNHKVKDVKSEYF